ncbi:MAG: putative zinc-binding protein [Methanoregulaceae archaeon]|nr:putative zinc-binding protein [Methanoregulaceae archaeon]
MKVLVTCSGISNTGKLTTQAAVALMRRTPGEYEWVKAKAVEDLQIPCSDENDSIIVIEGCTDHCASKKLDAAGIVPTVQIVATEMGIRKDGMADVRFEEIEQVVGAVNAAISGVDQAKPEDRGDF